MGFFLFTPLLLFFTPLIPLLTVFSLVIVNVFFAISFYKTAQSIGKKYCRFPMWFCWLFIIPFIDLVFKWIMVPFALLQALCERKFNNDNLRRSADRLFGIGIAYMILLSLYFFFSMSLFFIVAIILWITYWSELVKVRKRID